MGRRGGRKGASDGSSRGGSSNGGNGSSRGGASSSSSGQSEARGSSDNSRTDSRQASAASQQTAQPKDRVLFMDHLPFIRLQSGRGVIFLLFENGDACFVPTEQVFGTQVEDAKMLSSTDEGTKDDAGEHNTYFSYDAAVPFDRQATTVHRFQFKPGHTPRRVRLSSRKRFLLLDDVVMANPSPDPRFVARDADVRHEPWTPPCLFVFQILTVAHDEQTESANLDELSEELERLPKTPDGKLALESEARLVQLQSALQQLRRQRGTGARLELLFRELSQSFVDSCFSPDDRFLTLVPSHAPNYLFMFELPKHLASTLSSHTQSHALVRAANKHPTAGVAFEARQTGQLRILGPATGWFGQPHCASAITSAQAYSPDSASPQMFAARRRAGEESRVSAVDYITWTDDGTAEFCVWQLQDRAFMSTDDSDGLMKFCVRPYLAVPCAAPKASWWAQTGAQQNFILDAGLPPPSSRESDAERRADGKSLVTLLLRRVDGERTSIDVTVIEVDFGPVEGRESENSKSSRNRRGRGGTRGDGVVPSRFVELASVPHNPSAESASEAIRGVGRIHFMRPLLLNPELPCASVCVYGKGLCEMADGQHMSWFQASYDRFRRSAVLVCHVDEFQRFWIEEGEDGAHHLRSIAVMPREFSEHPDWNTLTSMSKADQQSWRSLAKRVGYSVSPVESRSNPLLMGRSGSQDAALVRGYAERVASQGQSLRWQTVEVYDGLHLYRCFSCTRMLLKPMLCSYCKFAVYCSADCQKQHYAMHVHDCRERSR